jgi:hypothetical protein
MVEQSTSQNRGLLIKSGVAPSTAPKTDYSQLRRRGRTTASPESRPSIAYNRT